MLSRINAMKSFRRDDNSISQLYISAKLCTGLSFESVEDFIIIDRLHAEYAVDTLYMIFSSWNNTKRPLETTPPVRIHTLSAPAATSAEGCNLLSYAMGDSAQSTYSPSDILKSLEENHVWPEIYQLDNCCAFPQLPETRGGYKRLLRNLFGLPPLQQRAVVEQNAFRTIHPLNISDTTRDPRDFVDLVDLIDLERSILAEGGGIIDLTGRIESAATAAPVGTRGVSV